MTVMNIGIVVEFLDELALIQESWSQNSQWTDVLFKEAEVS